MFYISWMYVLIMSLKDIYVTFKAEISTKPQNRGLANP